MLVKKPALATQMGAYGENWRSQYDFVAGALDRPEKSNGE
jgi:hypothetical protein